METFQVYCSACVILQRRIMSQIINERKVSTGKTGSLVSGRPEYQTRRCKRMMVRFDIGGHETDGDDYFEVLHSSPSRAILLFGACAERHPLSRTGLPDTFATDSKTRPSIDNF